MELFLMDSSVATRDQIRYTDPITYNTPPETFLRREVINDALSKIWTERYSKPGEFELSVPATPTNISKYALDAFVARSGSKEIMRIDTQKIKDEVLTVSGSSLLAFLDHRAFRFDANDEVRLWKASGTVGYMVRTIVEEMLVPGETMDVTGGVSGAPFYRQSWMGLGEFREILTNFSMGTIDTSGPTFTVDVPFGQILPVITDLIKLTSAGMKLYLNAASVGSYSLKFDLYYGRDVTSTQSTYPPVIFSPVDGSLNNVEELRSNKEYKNVCHVFAPNWGASYTNGTEMGLAYDVPEMNAVYPAVYPTVAPYSGFNRKLLIHFADELIAGDYPLPQTQITLQAILDRIARDELLKHNYTRVADGEVSAQSRYTFGTDYLLGDIVELNTNYGTQQRARITEYIWSEDNTGEREHPTIEIV